MTRAGLLRNLSLAAIATTWIACASATPPQTTPPVSAPTPQAHTDAVPLGPTVAERLAEIRRRVQDASRYPPISRMRGVSGETIVVFEIDDRGRPEAVEAVRSSGNTALDRAAVRAVEDAGPLPVVYGRVRVPVRFSLSLRDADTR